MPWHYDATKGKPKECVRLSFESIEARQRERDREERAKRNFIRGGGYASRR